jgi:peptide/nickel transport system permease protein
MRLLIRRLEFFVITLWAALTINFFLPRLMPGDPVEAMMAHFKGRINPQIRHALSEAFGINNQAPLPVQYRTYIRDTATGQFGTSFTFFPDPVIHVVLVALPWTLGLVGMATIISFVLGTLIGMLAAWRRGGALDSLLPPLFVLVSAFPYFWIGLLCLYLFSLTLNWLPTGFAYDQGSAPELSLDFVGQVVAHAILPGLTIVITAVGGWILTMRNNMITTLAEDYIKMARAKGLSSWRIMLQYAGRNAVLPNLTGFAMSLGFVISGALLVEIVFTYPGVGFVLLRSVQNEDYPLMQALFLLITLAVLVAVLVSDVLTVWLDPRTREPS